MSKTLTAIVGGIFGVAMLALIVSPNGGTAIRNFFGGVGYATAAAQSPVTGVIPNYPRQMHGIQNPRLRPYVAPGTRTTLGALGPNLPSRSHESWGIQGEVPGGQPTRWTPWGTFVAVARPLNRLRGLGPASPTMSPGAYYTPPALFQITGIPEHFLNIQVKPFAGRTSTPFPYKMAINPFPSFRGPLPSYPAPAGFRGSL